MKRIAIPHVLLPLTAILLEILPYGAVLRFSMPPDDGAAAYIRKTYSYFSLVPYGYANFGPLLTALFSCLLLLAGIVYAWTGKGQKAIRIIAVTALLVSFAPLLFGISYFSAVGAAISAVLGAEVFFAFTQAKKQ